MNQIITRATSMGLRVYFLPLPHDYEGYFAEEGVIVVNSRLPEAYQREVLAHELGHAHYGHDWRNPHDRDEDERQADLYAAKLLISPIEYELAERCYEHPAHIARELSVFTTLLDLWRDWAKTRAIA